MSYLPVWIILVVFIYLAVFHKKKKKDPSKPKPTPFKFPDEPLVSYFLLVARPYLDSIGDNLGLNEIVDYRYNCARMTHNAPANVYYRRSPDHNWAQEQVSYFEKAGSRFILGQYDMNFFGALDLQIRELKKAGIVCIFSMFDGCGLKYANTAHWSSSAGNDRGWHARDTDAFFRVGGQWWGLQKDISHKVVDELGHHENLVLELANEPFGSNGIIVPWHERMMWEIVEMKNARGYDHLKISMNANWNEFAHIGCEFVWTHQPQHSRASWNNIHQLNPNGYGNLAGKCGKSFDWGHKGRNINMYEQVTWARELGHSYENLALEGRHQHEQVKAARGG